MVSQRINRIYFALNVLALLLSLLIVFFSTHIRLGEAGLGCAPWPECYAQLSFADGVKGLAIPDTEFKLFRSFHRGIASLLGLNILIIVGICLWKRREISPALPLWMLAVVVFLSVLGVATPTRALPIVTMGNILGGIALSGFIWAHLLQVREHDRNSGPGLKLLLIAVIIQIAGGAWASANYTGAACPGIFTCTHTDNLVRGLPGSFNPARKLALDDHDLLVLDTNSSIIQYTHRILAVAWLALVIYLFRTTRKQYPHLEKPFLIVVIISLVEFALGIANVVLDMPLWPNTLHNLLAVALLCAVLNVVHGARKL
ncbi:MAG: COX15/CtaA family protein [Proteobacteria bacterium]|nr:COX15/CtaA family protein [Pseudomonadota bacterium]